jgi:hypothetical protein
MSTRPSSSSFFSFSSSPDGLPASILCHRPSRPLVSPARPPSLPSSAMPPWSAATALLPLLSCGRDWAGGHRSSRWQWIPLAAPPLSPLLSSVQPRVTARAAGDSGSLERHCSTMVGVLLCNRDPLWRKTRRRKKRAVWSFHQGLRR